MTYVKFTDELPPDGATVTVRSTTGEWDAEKILRFEANWWGAGGHRLVDGKAGRWYWYPERMEWRRNQADVIPFASRTLNVQPEKDS